MSQLIQCPVCKQQISSSANSCPHCGEPLKKAPEPVKTKHAIFLFFGVAFIIAGIAFIADGVQTMSRQGLASIPTSSTTPAAFFLCVGVFCAVAPFCKSK